MRIAIFITVPADTYSGGRYCAFMMGEALAQAGHDTWMIADNTPVFFDDFAAFPRHRDLRLHRTRDYRSDLPAGAFDCVVLVPGSSRPGFYLRAQRFAMERNAHLVFLNFESPNWFNALSPVPRAERAWAAWKRASRFASLILSISREGQRWAEDYYAPESKETRFDFAYPALNTAAADAVPDGSRARHIVVFARFSAAEHKGSERLEDLFCREMMGHTLVVILGKDDIPRRMLASLAAKAREFGVHLELRHKLADREKFEEIKRARLVLFPSAFEGFGYPPVEALYCNTPCVAFDLPVLRETCGDRLLYAEHGNWDDFRTQTGRFLASSEAPLDTRSYVRDRFSVDAMGDRLNEAFAPLERTPPRHGPRPAIRLVRLRVLDALRLSDPKYRYLRFRGRVRAALRKAFRGGLGVRESLARRTGRIVYFPAFESPEALTNHYHRAAWYLPRVPNRCESVDMFFVRRAGAPEPGARPECMAPPPNPPGNLRLRRGRLRNALALLSADCALFWDRPPSRTGASVLEFLLGPRWAHVATEDFAAVEYGAYCGLLWNQLATKKERSRIIRRHRERFTAHASRLLEERIEAACVFGTGPSLSAAYDFDFSNTLCIVCNSIVQDERLLDHIQPRFICAGDVVSHFGVSAYAHRFRADLVRALLNRDLHLLTTAPYGFLLLQHYPEIAHKVFLVEHGPDGPVFDLRATYALPRLDSTLNIHMLPLAATFSKTVWLLGCDGKAPAGDREDFWAHAARAQYHDLVDSSHACHPTFDVHRQLGTYERYKRSVSTTLREGERQGIVYRSLRPSFIPGIAERVVSQEDLDGLGAARPYSVARLTQALSR